MSKIPNKSETILIVKKAKERGLIPTISNALSNDPSYLYKLAKGKINPTLEMCIDINQAIQDLGIDIDIQN